MKYMFLLFVSLPFLVVCKSDPNHDSKQENLQVKRCADFEVTGDGTNTEWNKTSWIEMQKRSEGPSNYKTRFKMMYSETGIYLLFDCEDNKLTTDYDEDFSDMYKADVVEVFFWTDERYPLYFEYEINPLNKELVLIIPNIDDKFLGWIPWHYDGLRKTRKSVSIRGGEMKSGASVDGWSAEVFFPYDLLKPLANVPPKSGMTWKGNFYRIDYDGEKSESWTWTPIKRNFHDFKLYKDLVFE